MFPEEWLLPGNSFKKIMPKYRIDNTDDFVIEDYNRVKSFSGFLPGIAGKYGVPLWSFYVNRAQAVVSFGVRDKDHSIQEFYPANKAYQEVFDKGFRTFLKVNNKFYEPFSYPHSGGIRQVMRVNSAFLEIRDGNPLLGVSTKVTYFTLPWASFPSLIRWVEISNDSGKDISLTLLDGMPQIVPYGINHRFLKDLSRTLEAWMGVSIKNNTAFYKLRVLPDDTARTVYVKKSNFYFSLLSREGENKLMPLIADPACIFPEDASLFYPEKFIKDGFKYPAKQILSGKSPCAFSFLKTLLKAGSSLKFYTFIGSSEGEESVRGFVSGLTPRLVERKFEENREIIERIKHKSFIHSSLPALNGYVQQSYLDNVLRGGFPEDFRDGNKTASGYLYSRKHGDLERDYNNFKFEDSVLSAGEGNFRDVNQNRRCDLFFNPFLKKRNIRTFFNLQRADGYNPLVVKPDKYIFLSKSRFLKAFKRVIPSGLIGEAWILCSKEFSLSGLAGLLNREGISPEVIDKAVYRVLSQADEVESAEFGEGFWIDHWTYNLDLVLNYLSLFPDEEEPLLFENTYSFYDDSYKVSSRAERYYLKGGRVLQGKSVSFSKDKNLGISHRKKFRHRLRIKGTDKVVYTNLIVKILVLILNKTASLDPFGRGIEMEAGKPGWCDALNGLPALLGSSLSETWELKRLCLFLKEKLGKYRRRKIKIDRTLFSFLEDLNKLLREDRKKRNSLKFWDRASSIKENYREDVFTGFSGKDKLVDLSGLEEFVTGVINKIDYGLKKIDYRKGLPAYFINEVVKFRKSSSGGVIPLKFKQRPLPMFLEGFVRAFKVLDKDTCRELYGFVKKSRLYDKKLKMFKLNESLTKESLEIGRIKVFKPGWLENESIWMHMEYKFLLALLEKGLYREFYEEFNLCLVCFLKPETYGRSILENSSFIVSSSYADKSFWGRGFAARLSGSTAELINIITLVSAGKSPFKIEKGKVYLEFSPLLKGNLFTKREKKIFLFFEGEKEEKIIPKNSFCFKFLSDTLVVYHNPKRKDTYLDSVRVNRVKVRYKDGEEKEIHSSKVFSPDSLRIRNREAEVIEAFLD